MGVIKVGNASIGEDDYCYVIAEAGSNHEKKKSNAFELIEVAAEAGADAVKFQLFKAETLYSKSIGERIFSITKHVELPREWIPELKDRCKSNKITFLATPFDFESVDLLNRLDIPAIKWASGEAENLELLAYAAKKRKPLIIATGMCDMAMIEKAVNVAEAQKNKQLAILHCISLYPTDPKYVNLRVMDTLSKAFGYPVGYSDHTLGIPVALAAVARGAKILEKHFTLGRKLDSPDHPFSLKPNQLRELVTGVRSVSYSLGDSKRKMSSEERQEAKIACRSLVAACGIRKGTRISQSMLTAKRPGTGIHPAYKSLLVGKKAAVDISEDDILTWDKFA